MIGEVIERCPTGIPGFDRICQGGFVRNSDNLVIGGPGSGKSTFLMQFLWNGLTKYNENGLYISFEPDIMDTLEDARSYGWDFTAASSQGRIKFMRFAPQTSADELKKELRKMISRHNVQRICFDPVSILALNQTDQGKIRQTIFELSSLMKRLKVTTLYADESLEGESMQSVIEGEWTKTDILRFLSDSVTVLYEGNVTGFGERAIRISKMRRTKHKRKPYPLNITNQGIDILDEQGNKIPGATQNIQMISAEQMQQIQQQGQQMPTPPTPGQQIPPGMQAQQQPGIPMQQQMPQQPTGITNQQNQQQGQQTQQ